MATLLSLPHEVRFCIYDSIVQCTGVVKIYSQYDIAKEVNKDTVQLMHVCQTIRLEVQEHFYKHQTFRFASTQAVGKFLDKIGAYHTSIIANVHIGPHLSRRVLENFVTETVEVLQNRLTGVERLVIEEPYHGFAINDIELTKPGEGRGIRIAGPKTHAILSACPRLARGNMVERVVKQENFTTEDEFALMFVPKNEKFPAQRKLQIGHQHRVTSTRYRRPVPIFEYIFFQQVFPKHPNEASAENDNPKTTTHLDSVSADIASDADRVKRCIDELVETSLDPTKGPCYNHLEICRYHHKGLYLRGG